MSARTSRAPAPRYIDEHRARQLGGPLEIEDAELGADVPVRHPLVLAVGSSGRTRPFAARRCRRAPAPSGASADGGWGCASSASRTAVGELVVLAVERAARARPSARLSACTASAAAASPARRSSPTSLDSVLDLRPQLVALGHDSALASVEVDDPVDLGRQGRVAAGAPGAARTASGSAADAPDVEHGGPTAVRVGQVALAGRHRGRRSPRHVTAPCGPSTACRSPSSPGEVAGPARTQRRRQDHHRRDPRGLPPADDRAGPGARPRPCRRPRSSDAAHRGDAPGAAASTPASGRSRRCGCSRRSTTTPRTPTALLDRVGLAPPAAGDVAPALRRRAAAPVARPGPRGPAEVALPRRADRRHRRRRPPARPRARRATCGTAASPCSSPPTTSTRPNGSPTAS